MLHARPGGHRVGVGADLQLDVERVPAAASSTGLLSP